MGGLGEVGGKQRLHNPPARSQLIESMTSSIGDVACTAETLGLIASPKRVAQADMLGDCASLGRADAAAVAYQFRRTEAITVTDEPRGPLHA